MRASDLQRRTPHTARAEARATVWVYAVLRRAFPAHPSDPRSMHQLSFDFWPDRDGSGRPHSARSIHEGWLVDRALRGQRLTAERREWLRGYLAGLDVDVPYDDWHVASWVSRRRRALREFVAAIECRGGNAPSWLLLA